MSLRFMRVIVFFDLPTVTNEDRKEYRKFRKFLLQEGFIMMQESVYAKIALNGGSANLIKNKVRTHKPKAGLVEMLTITEKQFSGIEFIAGNEQKKVVDSQERLIVL